MNINNVEFPFDPTDYVNIKKVTDGQKIMNLGIQEILRTTYTEGWEIQRDIVLAVKDFFVFVTGVDVVRDITSYAAVLEFVDELTAQCLRARKQLNDKYSKGRIK